MGERALFAAGMVAICAAALALAARGLDRPGLYYDEVIQADPAVQLLRGDGEPLRVPGARSVRVFDRWVPVMIQPYMGALKSHLLVPSFAIFGASPASLRLSTLAWGLLGLLLFALWARRLFGAPAALLATALAALDPSFLFVIRHDWGSVALGLVCRGGALLLLTTGFARGSLGRIAAGGLFLGLGLYNKIDFAVFLAGAGLALAVASPRALLGALRAPGRLSAAALGLALGAAPLLSVAGPALRVAQRVSGRAAAADLAEKLDALHFTLDGSYFDRLMHTGGSFGALADVETAASTPFLLAFAAAAVYVAAGLLRRPRSPDHAPRAFALGTAVFTILAVLATPRAVRIHHVLNAHPFPQLVVALALVSLWRSAPGALPRPTARRAAAAIAGAVLVLASARADVETWRTLHDTGGKGRWSDALERFGEELSTSPGAVVVSLDWGFDGPLRFVHPGLALEEPIWRLRRADRPGRAFRQRGTPRHVYLVFEPPYAVFDFGPAFLELARSLPGDRVTIRRHLDREGDPAFTSIRFADPHELVYRGTWEIGF